MRITRRACLAAGVAVAGVLSLTLNVLQARNNRRLQETVEGLLVRAELAPGTAVPPLEVQDLRGASGTIRYDESARPTLLYVFRPSCIWCERNRERFGSLVRGIDGRYRIIGISLSTDDLAEFVKEQGWGFPAYAVRGSTVAAYRLGSTPETIVVSPEGRVLESWKGAYSGPTRSAIEAFFSVHLTDTGDLGQ